MTATPSELRFVLDDLPPVQHAFGYGSGVMPQPHANKGGDESDRDKYVHNDGTTSTAALSEQRVLRAGSVVDFVFAVESPQQWHAENMALNPHHYACHLRMLGRGEELHLHPSKLPKE
jgi:translocator assembly and maintenance protein 41